MRSIACGLALVIMLAGCERERRDFKLPNGEQLAQATRLTDLQPGSPSQPGSPGSPFRDNAFGLDTGGVEDGLRHR